MKDSKQWWKEGGLWLFAYVVVLLVTVLIPVLNVLSLFFLPLPFLVFTVRRGWKPGVILCLVALFLSLFLFFIVSFPLTVSAALTGLLIGTAVLQKVSAYETWARGTLGYVSGLVVLFLFIQGGTGIDIVSNLNQAVDESIVQSQELLQNFDITIPEEDVNLIREELAMLLNLLPVILVAVAMFLALVTQWLGYKLLNKLDGLKLRFPPFRNYRLPIVVIWIYFIAVLFSWISSDPESSFYIGVINVLNLAGLLIALQGFSFLLFYAHEKKLSRAVLIISILIVILFPFMGLYLLRILGIIDLGFSLRDRLTKDMK